MFADNVEFLLFQENKFTNNRAVKAKVNLASGEGGSLYFSCNFEFGNCQMNITGNTFSNNSAVYEGGAIKWTMVEPTLAGNTMKNNSARLYGDEISSYSQKLV